jgi:hypothetical protein
MFSTIWSAGVLASAAQRSPVRAGHRLRRWTPLLPAVQRGRCRSVRLPCGGRGCPQGPGRADARCPAGRLWCPRVRTAGIRRLRVDLAQVTSADEQAQRARPCRRAATAAAGPPQFLPEPAGQPDTAADGHPQAAEPDTAHAVAARLLLPEPRTGVRTVGVRTVSVRRGHGSSLRVSAATGTGRLPGDRWTGAATAGRRERAGAGGGRRAGRARRSWPAAPRPGPPRRSAGKP